MPDNDNGHTLHLPFSSMFLFALSPPCNILTFLIFLKSLGGCLQWSTREEPDVMHGQERKI